VSFSSLVTALYNNFKAKKEKKLRKLKDDFLDEAIIRNSKLFFELAVTSYVLSKILSKPKFLVDMYKDELQAIEKNLRDFRDGVGKKSDEQFRATLEEINKIIRAMEEEDKRFFRDLISKGKIKMTATMYAKGVSLGAACEMGGVDQQEVLDYAGETMMFDRVKEEVSITERVKKARTLLK